MVEVPKGLCGDVIPPDIVIFLECCNIDDGELENVPEIGTLVPCW